ncbi:MAG: TonB-dependent receptor [Alistipes sp.]|jgi:TonB-linked SusC/RagA family outer membrane protein|nr:TonB-dependent receptor [Alistipes sp.]
MRTAKASLLLLLLGTGFSHAAEAYSKAYTQETFFTLEVRNRTIGELFDNIESSSEFIFFYMDETLDVNRRISVSVKNQTVDTILDRVFEGTDNRYEISDRQIVITRVDTPPPAAPPVPQNQNRGVSGTVSDASGPIIGATVIIKGTSTGAITDQSGHFSLANAPADAVLEVAFIGYETREIAVGGQTQINIILAEDTQLIDDVVVVGYGVVQKKDLTGSIAQVQSDDLADLGVTRVDQALSGRLAGVQVLSTTGEPGAELQIRIRGVGSISAGTQPLYVIDGFPGDDLGMINPNDIETIDVLKDASATAIYGSRGANGVVIITTKRGREGQARIDFNAYYGWQNVLRTPKFLTKEEQADYYYEGVKNQNLDAGHDISGNPVTDWVNKLPQTVMDVMNGTNPYNTEAYDYIFRTAPIQSYNLSATGGSASVKYSVSGEYTSQDGIIIENDFERFSLRANLDAQLHRRVAMKFNINSTYSTAKNIGTSGGAAEGEGILGAATTWMHWYPLYDDKGDYFPGFGQDAINNVWNPAAQAHEIQRGNERMRTLANLNTEFTILDELKLNVMLGGTMSNRHSFYFLPRLPVFNSSPEGEDNRSASLNWITETTLNYNKSFGDHNLSALAGYTTQKYEDGSNFLGSQSYPNNLVPTLNAVSNDILEGNSQLGEWSLISYLARVNYNYKSKYYITASIRSDGSSRFGRDNKYGYFPSAALAWRISGENFLSEARWLNDLKLRASYGATGNNNIGNYAHLATVVYESYLLGGGAVGGFAPNNFANALLTWEKQSSYNVGFDLSMFNNRISLSADYFLTRNRNLLLNVNVPQTTGFESTLQNIGEVENRGWEASLNTVNTTGRFEWSTSFNISQFRNKVLKLGPEGAPIIGTNHITQIGQPMGMFYGYIADGIFKNQAELDAGPIWAPSNNDHSRVGDIRFKDMNGDGVINTDDRAIMGSPYPDFYFGMTNEMSYENFSLSFSIQGSFGNKVFNSSDTQMYTRARYRQYSIVKDYWKSESDPGDGNSPRPNNSPTGGVREKSTRYLDNGSYLKFNNITLSYQFDQSFAKRLSMSNLRLYVTATNPIMITKFRDFNPEVSNGNNPLTPGQMFFNYPLAKSYIVGINVSF